MVGTISRRDCLKLVLAASAAWLGSAYARPFIAGSPGPWVSVHSVPIESLDLGVDLTNVLRSVDITTIGKLLSVLGASDHHELRKYRRPAPTPDWGWDVFSPSSMRQIRAALAGFRVPSAMLTRPESEVWTLANQGYSVKGIVGELNTNREFVETQLRGVYRKMARGWIKPF